MINRDRFENLIASKYDYAYKLRYLQMQINDVLKAGELDEKSRYKLQQALKESRYTDRLVASLSTNSEN